MPTLTSTHGSRHAARRPGPIGAWTAVTPVTGVHPPFAFVWSAVKEYFIGVPTEPFKVQVHATSPNGAHVSPSTQGTSSGIGWTGPRAMARSDARLLAEEL